MVATAVMAAPPLLTPIDEIARVVDSASVDLFLAESLCTEIS